MRSVDLQSKDQKEDTTSGELHWGDFVERD